MGDHTEAVSIDYDPKVISYEKLLDYFWRGHRCDFSNKSRQYMNAVFYQNEKQKKLAEKSLVAEAARKSIPVSQVKTKILPVKEFTYAEGYHQKYALTRYRELRQFLNKTYPTSKALADSTVATRLNAYLGTGTAKNWKQFLKELPTYGLPKELEDKLRQRAQSLQR